MIPETGTCDTKIEQAVVNECEIALGTGGRLIPSLALAPYRY